MPIGTLDGGVHPVKSLDTMKFDDLKRALTTPVLAAVAIFMVGHASWTVSILSLGRFFIREVPIVAQVADYAVVLIAGWAGWRIVSQRVATAFPMSGFAGAVITLLNPLMLRGIFILLSPVEMDFRTRLAGSVPMRIEVGLYTLQGFVAGMIGGSLPRLRDESSFIVSLLRSRLRHRG